MTEHDTNMRDLAAMFAMCGLIMRGDNQHVAGVTDEAYHYADAFMKSRDGTEQGIAAIKRKKKSDATD